MEDLLISAIHPEDEQMFDRLFSQIQAAVRRARTAHMESKQPPNRQQIESRAYRIFQKRGGLHGRDLEDWFEAERQLREETPSE